MSGKDILEARINYKAYILSHNGKKSYVLSNGCYARLSQDESEVNHLKAKGYKVLKHYLYGKEYKKFE